MTEPVEDRDLWAPTVTKVKQVHLVPKDLMDPKVQLVPWKQGLPGPKGAPGSFARNWKQCVFKNLDENNHSGLIKVKTQFTVKDMRG